MVIALIVAAPPAMVLAKEPVDLDPTPRDSTGGVVHLDLVDVNGNHICKRVDAGVSAIILKEGKYHFYAATVCGNQAGLGNLNVSKELLMD